MQSLQLEWLPQTIQASGAHGFLIENKGQQYWHIKQLALKVQSGSSGNDRRIAVQIIIPGVDPAFNPILISPAVQPVDTSRLYLWGVNLPDEAAFTAQVVDEVTLAIIKRTWTQGYIHPHWKLRFFDVDVQADDDDLFSAVIDLDVGVNISNRIGDPNHIPTKFFIPEATVTPPEYALFPIYARYDFSIPSSITVDDNDQTLQVFDLSGHKRHAIKPASGNAPTYNGSDAAEFDSTNSEWLAADKLAPAIGAAHTIFWVFTMGDLSAVSATVATLFGAHNAGATAEKISAYVTGRLNQASPLGDVKVTGEGLVATDEIHVLCIVAQGAVMYLYLDGLLLVTFIDSFDAANTFSIGQNNVGLIPSQFFEGKVGEIVLSDTQVEHDTILVFSEFLKGKWSIPNLPVWYQIYESLDAWWDFTRFNTVVKDGSDFMEQQYSRALPNKHLFQSDQPLKPLYVSAGINGLPSVQFNGTSHYMIAAQVLSGATEFDVYAVISVASLVTNNTIFGGRPNTGDNVNALTFEVSNVSGGAPRFVFNGTVLTASDLILNINTPYLLRFSFDGTTMRLYRNGVASASTATPAGSVFAMNRAIGTLWMNGLAFGSYFQGLISEIGFSNVLLTPQQDTDLTAELMAKYNIT